MTIFFGFVVEDNFLRSAILHHGKLEHSSWYAEKIHSDFFLLYDTCITFTR